MRVREEWGSTNGCACYLDLPKYVHKFLPTCHEAVQSGQEEGRLLRKENLLRGEMRLHANLVRRALSQQKGSGGSVCG